MLRLFIKMKHLPALVLAILVALSPKTEAQLNGEYSFSISEIFGTSPYTMQSWTEDDWSSSVFDLHVSDDKKIHIPTATCSHNPRNGSFSIRGTTDFVSRDYEGNYQTEIHPSDLNANLDGDYWTLNNPPIAITGKTYTDKRTKKSLLDVSGAINLRGTYAPKVLKLT